MIGAEPTRSTAENYRRFAELQARGRSPRYEEFAAGIAGDPEVLALIDSLPQGKRQPNLVLGAVRFVTGDADGYPELRRTLLDGWARIRSVVLARSTQTNEIGRCAALLPVLSGLPQPLALLEVGASAGLCLRMDRYRYDYGVGESLGPSDAAVTLRCELRGDTAPPSRLPEIAWRAGLDLAPVDISDPDDVRWLETLVWPGQPERLTRLRTALADAAAEPPRVIAGDLRTGLAEHLADAPPDATRVVLHSAVLAYLPPEDRAGFVRQVAEAGAIRIGYEGEQVLAGVAPTTGTPSSAFLISRDDRVVARADPHGAWLESL